MKGQICPFYALSWAFNMQNVARKRAQEADFRENVHNEGGFKSPHLHLTNGSVEPFFHVLT